jgi:hypothetical protein
MARYRRSAWWASVAGGTAALAVALAVLKVGASVPASVQISGSAGAAGAARSYDIIVSPPAAGPAPAAAGQEGWSANAAQLDTLSGGITLAQYDAISTLPGVAVAAPMTMVGYVPFMVSAPLTIPSSLRSAKPRDVTITVRLLSDNGLSTVTWDDATLAYPDVRPSTLSVRLSWTFELPLVAVDPLAEAALLHLDSAVTSGGYLPEAASPAARPVPMLIAGSIASDEEAQVTVDSAPTQADRAQASGGPAIGGTGTLTTARAYRQLLGEATKTPGTVTGYWTASPVSYSVAPDGAVAPRPVATDLAAVWGGPYQWAGSPAAAGALDTPFRSLTQHAALAGGAKVQAVGVFNPAALAAAPATPSPYQPELLTGADPRSQQLLGGQPLAADGAPGDYPGTAASLVMPLSDLGAFASRYASVDEHAPIGVIRIRVAGAAGDTAASQDKIRAVAQEIVRATGLHVQAVPGTTASTRVVDLPAGLHGRPALQVDEVWFRNDVQTTVWSGLGPDSVLLTELELLAGEVVIGWGTWRIVRSRRGELATLRALGWRRSQLGARLLTEFALAALVAFAAAVLGGYAIGAALSSGPPGWAWLLLAVPVGATVVVAETWRPRMAPLSGAFARIAAQPRAARWLAGRARRQLARPAHPVRRLLRAPGRTVLAAFVITVAGVALSLELATRWAFAGANTSWTVRPVTGEGLAVDIAAVFFVVLMATFTAADLIGITLRERAAELSTLRAIGWPAREVTRITLRKAAWSGLLGGLAAGGFDLLGGLFAVGSISVRLIALGGLAVAVGMVIGLLAGFVSKMFDTSRQNKHFNIEEFTCSPAVPLFFRMTVIESGS